MSDLERYFTAFYDFMFLQYSKLLLKLMRECWHFHSSARLTSQYIKKSLQKFLQDQDSEESVGSSTGTASTGIS